MNEYELIGRLADLDTRLKKLEGVEPKPQPAPAPKLVEAVEALVLFVDQHCNYYEIDPLLADCRQALAREKKRQELVGQALATLELFAETGRSDLWVNARLAIDNLHDFDNLDAFDNQCRRDSDKDGGK